jgi:hypothetical protein
MNNLVNNMHDGDKSVIILWQYAFNNDKCKFTPAVATRNSEIQTCELLPL